MNTLKSDYPRRRKPRLEVLGASRKKMLAKVLSYDLEDLLVANGSQRAFRRFLRIAQRLCGAGSAGLSLLRLNAAGQAIIRWEAVSGELAPHEGAESPRDASPCGACLDAARITILAEPQRAFPRLAAISPVINQDLIVPLFDRFEHPVGTLWIAHHDPALHFDPAEVHIAGQLGIVLARALRTFAKDLGRQQSASTPESHAVDACVIAHDLSVERGLREHAEASVSSVREALVFKEAEIVDAHHRVKNTMQIAANYLQLQAGKTTSSQVSAALLESYARLRLLADVHELLYKSGDTARRVPVRDLLETVAQTLKRCFGQLSERVVLRTALAPILLEAHTAIPLALLANEAATNAYKHAFADGRTGEVSLSLYRTAAATLVLEISDNGTGLQSTTDRVTLGLELMQGFAAQLGGALVFSKPAGCSGTTLTLTIPAAAPRSPA